MTREFKISVVIPVRNEAKNIRACLDAIYGQTVEVAEIVVVDSGSTDGTLEILREYSRVKLIEIPPDQFNHGLTRNLGWQQASGNLLLFTVGDARASDEHWIEEMLAPMEADGEVMGVCGAQIVPHEKDKNPVEWYRPFSQGEISFHQFENLQEFFNLPESVRRAAGGWDDVSAIYRRKALEQQPFREISYGEDIDWLQRAYGAGWKLAFNPNAKVYHYHKVGREFMRKRTVAAMYLRHHLLQIPPTEASVLLPVMRCVKLLLREATLSWSEKLSWLRYNVEMRRGIAEGARLAVAAHRRGEADLEEAFVSECGQPPVPAKE